MVGDGDYAQAPQEVTYTYHDPGDAAIEERLREVTTDDAFVRGDYEHFDPSPSRLELDRKTGRIRKRTRPQRPLPSGVPTPDPHAWKSNPPSPSLGGKKKELSFGDARQITFLIEPDLAESKRVRASIRIGSDPPNTTLTRSTEMLQGWSVEVPQGWQATRQPGFGRAAASGQFPFSVREQFLNALMQGRIDPTTFKRLDANVLKTKYTHFNSLAKTDWVKMTTLCRSIQTFEAAAGSVDGVVFSSAHAGAFARDLDSKSLAKMLVLFESGATLA